MCAHRRPDHSALQISVNRKQEFLEDDAIRVLVNKLLNCQDERVSDKDTKLDVLAILANIVSISRHRFDRQR